MPVTKMKVVGYIISNRTSCLILSLFTKVSLAFSCTLPKVPCFQSFLLTHCDFCGNLSQQFNITYLLRVLARLPKEPEQVFNFLIATKRTRTKAIPEGMVRFRLLCGDFLLPDLAPHLENRKTVSMGYPAMTLRRRAGKRRRKGAGKPCRENGTLNIYWSRWSVDVVNDATRHSPEKLYALRLTSCGQNVHMR